MNNVLKIIDTKSVNGNTYILFTDRILYLSTGYDSDKATKCTFIHLDNAPAIKIYRDLDQVIVEIAAATSIDNVVKSLQRKMKGVYSAEELRSIADSKNPSKASNNRLDDRQPVELEAVMSILKRYSDEGQYSVEVSSLTASIIDVLRENGYKVNRKSTPPRVIAGSFSEDIYEVSF